MQWIYLDTNVYCRPFDDQRQPDIQAEANAFLEIVAAIKTQGLTLVCSDILAFEVHNILSPDKRAKVQDYLGLCAAHIDSSVAVLNLGKQIQNDCHIRARDALHIASAITGRAQYFLSCDKQVVRARPGDCYQRIARAYHGEDFCVMNPALFVEKMKRGGLQ